MEHSFVLPLHKMPKEEAEKFAYNNHLKQRVADITDGYHTFDELYSHRCALMLLAMRGNPSSWIAPRHADGSQFDGWFIAGMYLPTGPITYHMPMNLWDTACKCIFMADNIRELAPEWDGHTSNDVLLRILESLT